MRPELAKPSHSARCVVLGWRAVARGRGGPLRPSRPGGAYIAVFAMCAMTVPTTCTAIRRARFGAPVRQNNQNSQNEPGMSFGINQIVSRCAEEGACPLKNKDLLTMLAPYCESQGKLTPWITRTRADTKMRHLRHAASARCQMPKRSANGRST